MSQFRTSRAAEILGVSVDTIRRWSDEGRLRTTRTVGGHREIDGRDLVRLLAEQPPPESDGVVRSARNRFTGLVTRIERDGLTAIVELQAGPHRVLSLMTREGADELALEVGDLATAAIKATNVVIEIPPRG
jgi:molybdopterin-binding protein